MLIFNDLLSYMVIHYHLSYLLYEPAKVVVWPKWRGPFRNGPLHFAKWPPPFCQMDPSISNGPLHLAKWRGPFRKREGSICRNGGVFLEPNGGVHFAKWRGPFHKWGGAFCQMKGSLCGKRGGPFRNGPIHLARCTPPFQMDPSIWQNGGVHLPK